MSVHRADDFTPQDFSGLRAVIESLPKDSDLRAFLEHTEGLLKAGEDIVLYSHDGGNP